MDSPLPPPPPREGSFLLVSVEGREFRFLELASGAYLVETPIPGVKLPPNLLGGAQALALARHLEGTGLWRRGPMEDPSP